MKKIYNIIKKYKKIELIILSFLIPIIIYTTIFYINGLLTDKTIILGDMRMQYYPLFHYLKGIFNGTNSIFYSFSKGLGGTMFGTIFYYLTSPLNLFLILIDKQHIPEFITYLVILKMSICGLTMYLYMRRKFKTDNTILLTFSLLYAFMGYNLNYFLNIMWLDVVIMAPLVLIGIDKIIEGKSQKHYILTLFISIFSNYYISYMLCIFCVLYYIYEILLKYNIKKDRKIIKKITKKFIISSLLTGLMCSFFIIPCIFEMLNYGRNTSISKIFVFDWNFFNIFSKTYIGSLELNDNLNYTSMNLYCSIIVLPLIYFYFYNKNVDKKEKVLTLILVLTMILPCFIGVLNYIWHLFTLPSFYCFRYSFLLCLLFIRIGYKTYSNIRPQKTEILLYMLFYSVISILLIIITYYGNYYDFLNYKLIWLTTLLLIIYMTILYKSPKNKNKLIVIIMILESFLNIFIIFNRTDFMDKKLDDYKLDEIVQKYNKRMELQNIYNTSLIYNYKGINSFLSTQNHKNIEFLQKAGNNFNEHNNLYNNPYQSILADDIIGLEATIMQEEFNLKKLKKINKIENGYIKEDTVFENKDAFSIGYIIKNECNNLKFEIPYDQRIFNCIFNNETKFYKTPKIIGETPDKITYETKKDTLYYIIYDSEEELTQNIFGEAIENIIHDSKNYFVLKSNDETLDIYLYPGIEKETIKIYYFDYKEYDKTIKNIKLEQLNYKIEKNKLNGTINTNGGTLMITLPYEKGYIIKVDDKLVNYKKVLDTFIGIDLEKGEHKIQVEYEQQGLKAGAIISLISILTTTVFIRKNEKNENKV